MREVQSDNAPEIKAFRSALVSLRAEVDRRLPQRARLTSPPEIMDEDDPADDDADLPPVSTDARP